MPGKPIPKPSRFLSARSLRLVWDEARRQGKRFSSAGVDGITGAQFEKNLDKNIREIAYQIKNGTFVFQQLKSCWVPKKSNPNKLRLICIPTVRDRLVQRAIVTTLQREDRLGILSDVSYGFISGRGVHSAVQRAIELRQEHRWVLKTDISAFFDNIDRNRLRNELLKGCPKSLFQLVGQVIDLEVRSKSESERKKLKEQGIIQGRGLRQGMPMSPLLSNVELRTFDLRVRESGMRMVRYADDLAFFFDSQSEVRSAEPMIRQWLRELGHSIPELDEAGKTTICRPEDALEFLGMDLVFDRSVACYSAKIPDAAKKRVLDELRKLSTLESCRAEKWDLTRYLQSVASRVSGYSTVYKHAANIDNFLASIDAVRQESLKSLLKEIFGTEAVKGLTRDRLEFLGLPNLA